MLRIGISYLILFLIQRAFFYSGVSFSQVHLPDFERLFGDIEQVQHQHGKNESVLENGTRCVYSMEQGFLCGSWLSFYNNGNRKSEGKLVHGIPSGTWKVWSPDGKQMLKIEFFSESRYTVRKLRKSIWNYPVKWGRGKIDLTLQGKTSHVQIRKGMKHGKVSVTDDQKNKLPGYFYMQGSYHGKGQWFDTDGNVVIGEYEMGVPLGIWQYFDQNGHLIKEIDFSLNPYVSRVPSRTFIAGHELFLKQTTSRIITASHPLNAELFEPDSSGISFYSILEQSYIYDETVFYSDAELSNPVFHSSDRQHVSGLDTDILNYCQPVMIYYSNFQFLSIQSSHQGNMILFLTMVLKYEKDQQIKYFTLPFVYFPQMYSEIGNKNLYGKPLSHFLNNILNNYYYSVMVSDNIHEQGYLYDNTSGLQWMSDAFVKDIEWIDTVNDFWLLMAGL